MTGYWIRHRALLSMLMSIILAVIAVLLFVFPFVMQIAENYNSQSVYKNTSIDFIAPEPSYNQVSDLSGTNGIEKVFPFYMTKTTVSSNGRTRQTTVLLSDQFENVNITMYNSKRLIKESKSEYDNPILVDWKFCKDTATNLGDTVSFNIGEKSVEYRIAAIYETNSIYDDGAILAKLTPEQKEAIAKKSQNNGYSGMYISASDYNACQVYLSTDYRPLGRLKNREQFDSDEQYQVHYDAIMSSGYANEITDFRAMTSNLSKSVNPIMIWIGTALSFILIIIFNIVMAKRGSERGYFTKNCIPKGQNVKPYYNKSFVCETICFLLAYAGTFVYKFMNTSAFIPKSAFCIEIAFIPLSALVAELISLLVNHIMVSSISRKGKVKTK